MAWVVFRAIDLFCRSILSVLPSQKKKNFQQEGVWDNKVAFQFSGSVVHRCIAQLVWKYRAQDKMIVPVYLLHVGNQARSLSQNRTSAQETGSEKRQNIIAVPDLCSMQKQCISRCPNGVQSCKTCRITAIGKGINQNR
jgi:hypothetical protein